MVNQLTALDVTTAEHVRTLKSLTNMKDQAFFKIGELKYVINHFQEEVEKNQIMNEKSQLKNLQNINDIAQAVKE